MTSLERAAAELRKQLHGGKPATAKPATRQSPVKAMSEAERQSRADSAALFLRFDAMLAMTAEFGEPDHNLAVEFTERGLGIEEARAEFERRKSLRGWAAALNAVHSRMH